MWKALFRNRKRHTQSTRSQRLHLLALEDRVVPSTFWVTNTNDDGGGSLREKIEEANGLPGADVIRFAHAVQGTIALDSQLVITDDLTIRGPGADQVTVSGEDTTRVFAVLPADLAADPFVTPTPEQVAASPEVTIRKLTISNGLGTDAPGFPLATGFGWGGGLYSLGGTVHLDRVSMTDNRAEAPVIAAGGAVANEGGGILTVTRSHFADNSSFGVVIPDCAPQHH